jgi:hypothetical protein
MRIKSPLVLALALTACGDQVTADWLEEQGFDSAETDIFDDPEDDDVSDEELAFTAADAETVDPDDGDLTIEDENALDFGILENGLEDALVAKGALYSVSTFQSIGIYMSGEAAPKNSDDARVQFRVSGASTWREGLPLWYDARNKEYRGSLVGLTPNTTYEIRLTLDSGAVRTLTAKTWSEGFPIAKTVYLPESSSTPLNITQSGSAKGYILYVPQSGKKAVIDVKKKHDFNVIVNASYVIVRGVTMRGAKHSGVLLGPSAKANSADVSHVVIEKNDISGWGSVDAACAGKSKKFGANLHSGVFSNASGLRTIIIQRNRIHHPSTDANSWEEPVCNGSTNHPLGPQGISFRKSQGNLVIRYNAIYSDADHYFNDSMGELSNFSDGGFPNKDSDINGNYIRNCWDDGIESEGADKNVRIWGNFIDQTYIKIALASVYRGPIYVWKNVGHVSRSGPTKAYGQGFIKTRNNAGGTYGSGRVYLFNNTALTPKSGSGSANFISEFSQAERITNYRSLNNLMNVNEPTKKYSIKDTFGTTNRWDYDLLVGRSAFSDKPAKQEVHAKTGKPIFVSNWGLDTSNSRMRGNFALAPSSPGYDDGVVIPNFNDTFEGAAPDIGAHEAGRAPLEYGVNAWR